MRILTKALAITLAATSLAGCAGLQKAFEIKTPQQIEQARFEAAQAARMKMVNQCNDAPVLYANLTDKAQNRIYSLPGNTSWVCPSQTGDL